MDIKLVIKKAYYKWSHRYPVGYIGPFILNQKGKDYYWKVIGLCGRNPNYLVLRKGKEEGQLLEDLLLGPLILVEG